MMKVQNKLSKISMFFSLFALAFILGGVAFLRPNNLMIYVRYFLKKMIGMMPQLI